MMTNNMMMAAVESRIDGVNGMLRMAGAPFQVHPVAVPKPNLGELAGFATMAVPEDGLMHPIVYWQNDFTDLTDKDLAKHIINVYIDSMTESAPSFSLPAKYSIFTPRFFSFAISSAFE